MAKCDKSIVFSFGINTKQKKLVSKSNPKLAKKHFVKKYFNVTTTQIF